MKKILIIDDEFIFRQGLRYMMNWEACGYTIVGEASNGQEGLSMCADLQPDLIICDVVMPVLSGVEFVRELQASDAPPVIMLSNFDEYDKVRKAFQYGASDYILKSQVTKEMLLSCLERITSTQNLVSIAEPEKDFGVLMRQVLDGYAPKPYEELTAYLQNRFSSTCYMLLLLDSPQPDFKNESQLLESIHQLLPSMEVCAASTTQHHAVCLLGIADPGHLEWVSVFIEHLMQRIQHTSCVLGCPFSSLSDIKELAEKLYELSKYSILYENKLCFYEEELAADHTDPLAFPSEQYFSYIRSRHLEKACACFLEYLDLQKNRPAVEPYRFRKFVEHTFYTSLRELKGTDVSLPHMNRIELKLFKQLDNAITFVQFRDALANAFGELASLYTQPRQEDTTVHNMLDYLEDNYSRQLTLYDVAEHLHMNYSYLSAYISPNTGKHFSEHLNDTRIRHAKELLDTTDKSISFISEAIGYTDQSYFGKMFKKSVGLTPLQYRNHAMRKES